MTEPKIRAGELYSRGQICEALNCGEWYLDALVSMFGLIRLGSKVSWYEGGDVIAALRRHAVGEVVRPRPEVVLGKAELAKMKRDLQSC